MSGSSRLSGTCKVDKFYGEGRVYLELREEPHFPTISIPPICSGKQFVTLGLVLIMEVWIECCSGSIDSTNMSAISLLKSQDSLKN